ncbi:hypothetical protein LCGC14_0143290 [marine sediment metagenome]|uniref:Uncharacterized protein n=1 Tax=marine sediment metagenome TaxID=412755 RepID=A0A0F9V1E2_9ZZZZ
MKNKTEQRVTIDGIAKKLLPKVQEIQRELRGDLELLDYTKPNHVLPVGRATLTDLGRSLDDAERHLRGVVDG